MLEKQNIFLPEKLKIDKKVSGNSVLQLEHIGHIESLLVEKYRKHGVEGWTLHRPNEERILVVSKKTAARPYNAVLLFPGKSILPGSKEEVLEEYKWIDPKPISGELDLYSLCSEVRTSWTDAFRFIEEERDGHIVNKYGLRSPQMGALYAALAHWKVTEDVGTVVMPTGTGKTEIMLALFAKERPEKLLIIVPNAALREQISHKFLTFGILQEFGVVEERAKLPIVGKMEHKFDDAENASLFLSSCNVVIATMQVISQCSEKVQQVIASGCSHLFVDEAHHTPARTWNSFRDLVCEYKKPVLQFTATPYRRDGKHVGGKPIFTYPLRKAQEEGYFTEITFIPVWEYNPNRADLAVAERATQVLERDLLAGYDHLLMARTGNIERAQQVHEIYAHLVPRLNPVILHSKQKPGERADAISLLCSRQSRIIICVDMLGEGFDLPQLKVAALHDVHKSLAITIQFTGRFTRAASGIGEATIIANAADADVEEKLEDLYIKDSDWNKVLRKLSEGETSQQRRRSEFLEGFQDAPTEIALQNVHPKISTVVYKTACVEWKPHAIKSFLESTDLLVKPIVHSCEKVILYITCEQKPVTWGVIKNVQDLVHDLYLIYWDNKRNLLFINSTNNKSTHLLLAKSVAGEDVELIRGETIYRCLHGVNRLILSNLGLLHLLSRSTQFTLHVGSDIREGLSRASISNRRKSNLFSRGYEGGRSVTIGASHKGRIWSHRIAEDISEWVEWCKHIGEKLLDDSISTTMILEHAIIPEVISDRPSLVPLTIEWPSCFLERSDEAIQVEIEGKSFPFYETDIEITTFSETGTIRFRIVTESAQAEYKLVFKGNTVEYLPVSKAIAIISTSGHRLALTNWFQEEPPIITFEDTAKLEYNEIFRPKSVWDPYNASEIDAWDWSGTTLRKESQYEKRKNPQRLVVNLGDSDR